jgi:hypothetical protein
MVFIHGSDSGDGDSKDPNEIMNPSGANHISAFRLHPDILDSRRLRGICGIDGFRTGTFRNNMPFITGAVKGIMGCTD